MISVYVVDGPGGHGRRKVLADRHQTLDRLQVLARRLVVQDVCRGGNEMNVEIENLNEM